MWKSIALTCLLFLFALHVSSANQFVQSIAGGEHCCATESTQPEALGLNETCECCDSGQCASCNLTCNCVGHAMILTQKDKLRTDSHATQSTSSTDLFGRSPLGGIDRPPILA